MKYRGHSIYSRFNVGTIADYTGGDRDKLRSYMTGKGLETPRDVWLANLYAFLDIKIDAGHQWHQVIRQQAYEDDADLFIYHVGASYMAFCKPQSASDEWLLTENVYSIFEGPSTGEPAISCLAAWSSLERSCAEGYQDSLEAYANPEAATSLLQDLPIAQSSNAYASVTNYSPDDRFTFRCFELRPAHVNLINGLLLEEGLGTSGIAYKNGTAAAKAIKLFLENTTRGLKSIERSDSPRLEYLATLEKALQTLGGTATTVLPAPIISVCVNSMK
ncbi:hypothetical protein LTR56_015603 [Elasticomyces elasticus]|nr:hypothetical protein LTR56_015603 [Elasticomyces elasticus]KAK3652531.1 hypothetical protein LTR22_011618 [Elasticomyces elasticus]KAK4919236.1 hypothetical protein LTR49_013083 [Elasticomyces elasticus]KAK5757793.1 hypothetical protein LTS12_012111 [Elasticomyces elasticus]